jgi:hypothetical protein
MTNEHVFLVNMTLEIYIYIGDLKANATTSKYTRNLIQSKLPLKLAMESSNLSLLAFEQSALCLAAPLSLAMPLLAY